MEVNQQMRRRGVVPVVTLRNTEDAVPTAQALLAGGLDVMEVTLRTPCALEAIRRIAREAPRMCVGAGTVLTIGQTEQAAEAGAQFIVSPGFSGTQAAWCRENGLMLLPGCVTATEILAAMEQGLHILKFFPAKTCGGLDGMHLLHGPFPEVRFVPTGGINGENFLDYLAAPFIHAVGGSWLCPVQDIEAGRFAEITQRTQTAMEKIGVR
ncbi:MAG: bifunctional 4-hydroxy-2-oxoglutarate aldolase/2-dehydro-3-deoxy-phosphogluconate aldolase [Lawsonibacter sp.]|nr:bifunctional 4-hydroxy-2-oxoglutarate aldolase/2-dehydro-3-deoxy-phosphogluconate aldolase [Lawsonibacter sp.]